mmetsp:Transcript_96501/g.171571  ORF Transcript_96501/g.171571 Transcript_96501/m.171571 type:complete len:101 (-) Transcript_96501:1908-2210(-)
MKSQPDWSASRFASVKYTLVSMVFRRESNLVRALFTSSGRAYSQVASFCRGAASAYSGRFQLLYGSSYLAASFVHHASGRSVVMHAATIRRKSLTSTRWW